MKIKYTKPFKHMKNFSMDVNEEILEIIDELVKLTKASRSAIIGSLIGKGMSPLFRSFESAWKGLLTNKTTDENKKKKARILLQNLKKIEIDKWNLQA